MRSDWVLIAVFVVAVGLAGCGDSTGPSDAEGLDDYWIDGYYCYYPPGSRDLTWRTCLVHVHSGGAYGTPVSGLTVTCNGEALAFEQTAYYGDVSDIEPGENVTFRISDDHSSLELTLTVPGTPTDLVLQEGTWDFSEPSGMHTLTWQNPPAVADSVLVIVAGQGPHPIQVYAYALQLAGSASEVTLSNEDMGSFSGADVVSCAVTQGTRGSFADHSGSSEIWARAGVIADWSR
jgi:hypothetical protein